MNKKNLKLITIVSIGIICIICFLSSYIVCGFFGDAGKTIIAHITGLFTAFSCTGIGLFLLLYGIKNFLYFKYGNIFRLFIYISSFGNLLMALGYLFYLFLAISPSNYLDPAHAASSMLFDIATTSQAFAILLGYLVIYKNWKNKL